MPLLRKGAIDASPWSHHAAGDKAQAHKMVTLSDFLLQPDDWLQLDDPWLAVVQPDDDLDVLAPELLTQPRIGIAFPVFTDGRGYSHAKQLRHYHQFRGELIAVGDVRRDQIDFMARVGIDSFECRADIDMADWQRALSELQLADAV